MIAVTFLAAAVAGFVFAPLDPVRRTLLVLAALALVPSPVARHVAAVSNIAGLIVGLAICGLQWRSDTRGLQNSTGST